MFFRAPAGNERVLVVDDEPAIRKVVRMMLEKAGHDVVETQDGEDAIPMMNTGENRLMVDAVLCAMRIPKINDVEARAYLRDNFPHVPVGRPHRLTRHGADRLAPAQNGVVEYMSNPVDGEQPKMAVGHAMQRREMAWR